MEINFNIIKNELTGKYSIQIKQLPKNLSFKGNRFLIVYQYYYVYVD